jgi:hypothetical protein
MTLEPRSAASCSWRRELHFEDEGADVEILGRFLVDMGLLEEGSADGTFGPGMRAAVEQLQERLGMPTDGIFRPTYVAYVPQTAGAVGEPLISVGSSVSASEVPLTTVPAPARIRFAPTSTGASLINLQGAPLLLSFGDLQIPVSSLDPGAEEMAAIHAGLLEAVAGGESDVIAGEPDSGEPEQYSGGLLSLAEPQVRGVVPGTAVHVTSSGAQCLFRQGDGGWNPVLLPDLIPAVGTLGAVYVDAALIDEHIARDPLTLADDVLAECR